VIRRRLTVLAILLLLAAAVGGWRYCQWRDHRFDEVILAAARRYDVEPALVKAVVWRESWFNPAARGSKQEFGLMQIRAVAAQEWARAEKLKSFASEQLLDPGTNTLAGAWYLSRLLRRYQKTDRPITYTLADYNAGRARVLQWAKAAGVTNSAVFMERMDFPATKKYVEAVVKRCARYRQGFPADARVTKD
jgi:soluble lytic murein transglycosylase